MYIARGRNETILDYYNGIGFRGTATLRVGLYDKSGNQFTTTREIGGEVRNTIATQVKRTTSFGIYYRAKTAVSMNPYWEGTLWH